MGETKVYAAEIKVEPGDDPDIGIWVLGGEGRLPIDQFEKTHEVVELGGICANTHEAGLAIGWLRAKIRQAPGKLKRQPNPFAV